MSDTNKPKIYASCKAGCNWETIHKSDFEAMASHIRQNVIDGKCDLISGKEYIIFAPKDTDENFTCKLIFSYLVNDVLTDFEIVHTNVDKYADNFVFKFLDAIISETEINIIYEYAGIRYTETIMLIGENLSLLTENYLRVEGVTKVL